MSKARTSSIVRIGLKLDPDVALEALFIKRLLELAKPRREEWLRRLLIRGFCAECAEIRQLHRETDQPLAERYVPVVPSAPGTSDEDDGRPATNTAMPNIDRATPAQSTPMSLSALKAVIG